MTIEFESGEVGLAEPSVFTAFHVEARGDGQAVAEALGPDGARASDDHVWVSIAAVRRWAGDAVAEDWEVGFGAMVDFARSNGWLDESGSMIQAHIEAPA